MSDLREVEKSPTADTPVPDGAFAARIADATALLSSDPPLAEAMARGFLTEAPGDTEASLLLGCALRRKGDAASARAVLEPLMAARPDWPKVKLECALALGALGDNKAAIAILTQALDLDPNYSEAWAALGHQYLLTGDFSASDEAYLRHYSIEMNEPQLRRAATAMRDGHPGVAEDLVLEYLEANPDDVNAIKLLAEIASADDRNGDAVDLLENCLELAPDFAAARFRFAMALFALFRGREALAQIEQLLEREPRNPQYRNLKASILMQLGCDADAVDIYKDLAREFPQQPSIWLMYGHVLKAIGKREESIAAYRKSLELLPGLGGAYSSLINLKTFRFSDGDIEAMQALLKSTDVTLENRAQFHFALGKAYEDLNRYEESFDHYQKGNAFWRSTVEHNADETSAYCDRSRTTFTRELFAELAGLGCDAPDPIFIVGMPRAGSTLLEQILSSHSAIEGTTELPNIPALARRLGTAHEGLPYPEIAAYLEPGEYRALGEEYIETTRPHRVLGRAFFIDKMPNNFAHVGLIHLILPNAKIIDARRHPLASVFANFKQHFARGQNFAYSLTDISRYYADYVRLMAHFDNVLPGRIHRVFYEQMVEDTENEVRRLLEYLGLPFEEQCLRFYETERSVRTASSEQVRQPIYKHAKEHWQNYDLWLGVAKETLGAVLDAYPGVPKFD